MEAISKSWRAGSGVEYVGKPSQAAPPGDLDLEMSLLIGELGPDQPIALDYRTEDEPQVVVATDDLVSPWRIVTRSVDQLLLALGWTPD